MELPDPVDFAVPAFVVLVLAEMLVAWAKNRRRYEPRDTLTSLALGLGSTIAGVLSGGLVVALAFWVWQFRLFDIGYQWYWFAVAFVIDDVAYYVFHRSAHRVRRSEEHTSELQSLMRISYAVFCLKKKNK